MSDDTKVVAVVEDDVEVVTGKEVKPGMSAEEIIDFYKMQNKEVIETRQKAKAQLKETRVALEAAQAQLVKAKSLETELATLKLTLRNNSVKSALTGALKEAGALSVDTAVKLIDLNKVEVDEQYNPDPEKLKALIEGLKQSDAILFKQDNAAHTTTRTSTVARPAAGIEGDAYIAELKACKTQKQIDDVRAKYGK